MNESARSGRSDSDLFNRWLDHHADERAELDGRVDEGDPLFGRYRDRDADDADDADADDDPTDAAADADSTPKPVAAVDEAPAPTPPVGEAPAPAADAAPARTAGRRDARHAPPAPAAEHREGTPNYVDAGGEVLAALHQQQAEQQREQHAAEPAAPTQAPATDPVAEPTAAPDAEPPAEAAPRRRFGRRSAPAAAEAAEAAASETDPGSQTQEITPLSSARAERTAARLQQGESTNVDFPPKVLARRIAGATLLVSLVATGVASYLAYEDPTTLTVGVAGTLGVLSLLLYAIRAGAAHTRLRVVRAQLEVVRGGSKETFDLSSHYTPIEVVGHPGRPGWKVLFGRRGKEPLVITSSMVDPHHFMEVLRRFRPE